VAGPGGPATAQETGPGAPIQQDETTPRTGSLRRRPRQSAQRRTRTSLRFSDTEWATVRQAAAAAGLATGGFAAAAVLAAATAANPTAAIADYRRGIQELMESNRQLAAVGNNLNQVAHFLNAGGQPTTDLRQLLHHIDTAIDDVDAAVAHLIRR
jgi:hypothetical protein